MMKASTPHASPLTGTEPLDPLVPFLTATNWIRSANQCGVPILQIFEDEGIDTRELHPETAQIRLQTLRRIMTRCVEAARAGASSSYFPVVLGEGFAFEYLSDIETFITTSATLREATRALDWISALVSPYLRLTLSEHRDQARLVLDFSSAVPPATASAYIAEAVFATLLKFSRILLGGQALFGHVTFQHARHADATTCEAAFQIPVHFSEPINALWFERSLLDQPLRGAFPALHQEAARRVEERVAAQADAVLQVRSDAAAALVRQIEQLLLTRSHLLGQGIQALACEINIHARTLQRRLREVGESHSTILARVRYQLARNWLQDSRLSIELISERLGFTDRRSFTQAFARWSGLTPSQFRRQRA